jgi:hypothetical protein
MNDIQEFFNWVNANGPDVCIADDEPATVFLYDECKQIATNILKKFSEKADRSVIVYEVLRHLISVRGHATSREMASYDANKIGVLFNAHPAPHKYGMLTVRAVLIECGHKSDIAMQIAHDVAQLFPANVDKQSHIALSEKQEKAALALRKPSSDISPMEIVTDLQIMGVSVMDLIKDLRVRSRWTLFNCAHALAVNTTERKVGESKCLK